MPSKWLEYLNPTIEIAGTDTTAIHLYMSVIPQIGQKQFGVARVLDHILNAGLTTVNQNLTWQSMSCTINRRDSC